MPQYLRNDGRGRCSCIQPASGLLGGLLRFDVKLAAGPRQAACQLWRAVMLENAAWQPTTTAGDARTATSKDQFIDLASMLSVLRRRWAAIASMLALAVAIGATYVATTPQRYTASSLLLFDVRATEPFQQRGYPNPAADSAYVDSQVEVLKSEAIARSGCHEPETAVGPGIQFAKRRLHRDAPQDLECHRWLGNGTQ